MVKIERELRQMVRRVGLDIVDMKKLSTGHFRTLVEAPNGQQKQFSLPSSPSDYRAMKNTEADLRRFARENPAPEAAPAPAPEPAPKRVVARQDGPFEAPASAPINVGQEPLVFRRGSLSLPLTLLTSAFALLISPACVTTHLHRLTERSPTTCIFMQIRSFGD